MGLVDPPSGFYPEGIVGLSLGINPRTKIKLRYRPEGAVEGAACTIRNEMQNDFSSRPFRADRLLLATWG